MAAMKKYRVDETLIITAGPVVLTDEQAGRRLHLLKKMPGKGVYALAAPIMLKAGEVVGLKDVNKADLAKLTEVEDK